MALIARLFTDLTPIRTSVVSGGALCLAGVLTVAASTPALRRRLVAVG